MLKNVIAASALGLLVTLGGPTAQAAYGHASAATEVAAPGFVRLALNPQPEPPNKPQRKKQIKRGDPGSKSK